MRSRSSISGIGHYLADSDVNAHNLAVVNSLGDGREEEKILMIVTTAHVNLKLDLLNGIRNNRSWIGL